MNVLHFGGFSAYAGFTYKFYSLFFIHDPGGPFYCYKICSVGCHKLGVYCNWRLIIYELCNIKG
jgi:hypothetical protein